MARFAILSEDLMNDFIPNHYQITLTPDLETFRFSGSVAIAGDLPIPREEVILNVLELAIWRCNVTIDGTAETCPFAVDPSKEELRIRLPRECAGNLRISIDFEGLINDRMAGFYRSRYRKDGQSRYLAVTQFEESDARRAFPCLDHPLKKATFDIVLIVDDGLSAISNTVAETEAPADNGKKRVTFKRTPRMSTYLLFFGVGDFEFLKSRSDTRVRVATPPGMTPHAGYGLEFGRLALRYCEDYYRIPYPLPKMDLIAIPDFAFGAMENWGAITFRENLLLHYPDSTSRAGEERICEVIAHEIAHQWFGNLVTPSDWRYLWLNESFATFFGYGVVDHYHPEWGIWEQFIRNQTESALSRDGLHETFAIEIPGGEHVVINTSTAPIIYSKGGSILRQIKDYIGEDLFRKGLNHYLKTHAYNNAASRHLWESFEATSEIPVTRVMKSWIEQPGHPVVTVDRREHSLHLQQRRFSYLPNAFEQCWEIPLTVSLIRSDGNERIVRTLMSEETAHLDLEPDTVAYKVNARQSGFFRVHYATRDDLENLGTLVRNGSLGPEDRWGLQNDLYAMVRSANVRIDDYLRFLKYYETDDAFLPISSIAAHLFHLFTVLAGEKKKEVAFIGRGLLQNVLKRIGLQPSADEFFTTSLLRDQILLPAAVFGTDDVIAFALTQFGILRDGGAIHPDIHKSILQIGALSGGSRALDWLRQRFHASTSEHDRLNVLGALGWFKEESVMDQAFQFTLDDVPQKNKFIPIVAAAANPYMIDHLWAWYTAHLQELENFHPLLYERVIAAVIPSAGLDRIDAVQGFFDGYVAKHPHTGDVVRLALEQLAINVRMRKEAATPT
jgi:tricorn protease interacting factor F2/3